MAQNLTNFAAMLKIVYRQLMVDMLNSETALWDRFRAMPDEVWEGRDNIEWPLRIGRTQAFGSGRAGGPLPEPQHQPTIPMKVPLRFLWGRIAIDTPTMKVSKSNRGSFKRALEFEMDYFKEDFIDYVNELLWYDGRGVVALVNGAGSGTTTLNVDSPRGVAGSVNGARFLQPNMRIGILASDGSALLCTRRIVSLATDGTSVVLNQAVSASEAPDNGLIVRVPSLSITDVSDASYLTDPMGLLGHLDDGTYVNDYFNVNRTSFPVARTPVFSSVGALSTDIIQQGYDVAAQLGKGKIREHWMHHSTRRAYLALTVANRRFVSTGGAAAFDAGYKNGGDEPDFNGAPCKVDKDAPYATWFGLDPQHALNFKNTDFEWADEDGAILNRLDDVDGFEATARMFFNTCYQKPQASFRLDGISTTIVVAHVL